MPKLYCTYPLQQHSKAKVASILKSLQYISSAVNAFFKLNKVNVSWIYFVYLEKGVDRRYIDFLKLKQLFLAFEFLQLYPNYF